GLLQGGHAAQAAATGAGHFPALLLEVPEGAAGNLYVGVPGIGGLGQLAVVEVVGGIDDAGAEAEAGEEIVQVTRRDHHHAVVDTVEADGQGRFDGQRGVAGGGAAVEFSV